ncbi:MAG: hypothetical protein DPW09_20590 [Anaerolineae bacterium]|nr:SAVED domain-containing protein [Anaerolineales bacterium]MCQ3975841.1 hypothetical protein [Anaerolineae bacterium]
MASKEHIQKLIFTHNRRLQYLKEQQAAFGLETSPAVLIEIENIETELDQLSVDLSAFAAPWQSQHPQAPRVHIYNWGKPPAQFPKKDEAITLDWVEPGWFVTHPDKSRRPPTPEMWEQTLWPRLRQLPAETGADPWIRLEGQCAHSTGFAFGTIFRAKERYHIEVAQHVPDKDGIEYWTSTAQPPEQAALPTFTLYQAEHNISNPGGEGVIIVAALNNTPLMQILEDVGTYFGQAEAFAQIPTHQAAVTAVKGVLVLEATAAVRQQRPLEGWEAAGLARTSTQLVNHFKTRIKPDRLHLFMAAPLGLAVFMGHFWQNVNKELVFYEQTRTERVYTPTYTITLP